MSDKSAIEWTDATWNPVTSCSKVSPGCAHCYAERLSTRFQRTTKPWTPANAVENVALHPDRLRVPLSWRQPRMVFVNSMSDLFHELVPDAFIDQVFVTMGLAQRHTFQILTLAKTHVGEVLTHPIYMGRLRTGEPAGVAPIVQAALFSRVQTARERRRTRTPGRIVKRAYALRLRCAGCRRFLYGDVGRYRHPAPTCAAFQAAKPTLPRTRGHRHDTRIKGHSNPQAWYEDAVGAVLERIGRVDDATISEVVRLHDANGPRADELTLARIKRAREDAARRLADTRDVAAWHATMTRLDAEERVAREPVEIRRLTPPEIVDYTRSLPRLWADSGANGKQALVGAVFARLDVLGFQRLEYELTPDAIDLGLDAALPAVIELESKIGEFGRGERI